MKKIFYILSICVMTILQPSCDALDLAPEDYYGAGNFWKEASQPKAFMLGLHAQLRSYYDMFYTLGELRGGTQRVGTSSLNTSLNYADIRSQNISEDIPGISNWNGLYSPIMQVNHFIQEVENGCTFLDDATRSRYLGQAYGMRALYYFMPYLLSVSKSFAFLGYQAIPADSRIRICSSPVKVIVPELIWRCIPSTRARISLSF